MPPIKTSGPTKQHHKLAIGEKVNVIGKTADEELTETDKGFDEEKKEANQ
jgi:hypothetical protein